METLRMVVHPDDVIKMCHVAKRDGRKVTLHADAASCEGYVHSAGYKEVRIYNIVDGVRHSAIVPTRHIAQIALVDERK